MSRTVTHRYVCRYAWLLLGSLLTPLSAGLSHAGPVAGTVYDVDYLRAQSGGFRRVSYPRYRDSSGHDAGQMIYPYNNDTINYGSFGFVLDSTSGAWAPI